MTFLLPLACRRGGQAPPTTQPRPVVPYSGYFQSRVGDDIYLFATLAEKTAFHGTTEPGGVSLELFISRTGQRVFISSSEPALIPRIEAAYEQTMGTELAPFDSVLAPQTQPAALPPRGESGQPGTDAAAPRSD